MKRIILLLMIALMLTGCGAKGRPKDMRQEVYDEATIAYDAVKSFLDGNGSAKNLPDLINGCTEKIQNLDETGWTVSEKIKSLDVCNTLVKMSLAAIDVKLYSTTGGNVDKSRKDLSDALKELKKELNK